MNKRGAFLTLGMTLVSVLILSLGAAMLRNAEHSEERVMELASLDRLYNLDSSLQRAYRQMYLSVFPFNITSTSTAHSVSLFIPRSDEFTPDPGFSYFDKAHNVTKMTIGLMYPNFTSTTKTLFPLYDFTAFSLLPYNLTFAYTHIKETNPGGLFFSSTLPGHSNALIIYTNSTKVTDPLNKYLITVSNPALTGNVSWETIKTLPTGATLNITYLGLGSAVSSASFNIDFDGIPSGNISQNIMLNLSAPQPWPVISVSTAQSGPFEDMGQIMIEPLGHNLTVSVTVLPTTPLNGSVSAWSADSFSFALPSLKVSKTSRYRLV
jgi:hypothetical protein